MEIAKPADKSALLNKRSEIASKGRHQNWYYLSNFAPGKPGWTFLFQLIRSFSCFVLFCFSIHRRSFQFFNVHFSCNSHVISLASARINPSSSSSPPPPPRDSHASQPTHTIQCKHPWPLALGQSRCTRGTLDREAENAQCGSPVWWSLCVNVWVTGNRLCVRVVLLNSASSQWEESHLSMPIYLWVPNN